MRGEPMKRTLRQQAVGELMLEMIERLKQGQKPDPYWNHEIIVKERMKIIRARRKADKWYDLPDGMRPLAITRDPKDTKK
jgi:hypothetical protein